MGRKRIRSIDRDVVRHTGWARSKKSTLLERNLKFRIARFRISDCSMRAFSVEPCPRPGGQTRVASGIIPPACRRPFSPHPRHDFSQRDGDQTRQRIAPIPEVLK